MHEFILLAILLPLLLAELRSMAPYLAEKIIYAGARLLPAEDRERYREEWLGELSHLEAKTGTKLGLLGFAVIIVVLAAPRTRWVLRGEETLAPTKAGQRLEPKQLSRPRSDPEAEDLQEERLRFLWLLLSALGGLNVVLYGTLWLAEQLPSHKADLVSAVAAGIALTLAGTVAYRAWKLR